MDNSHLGQPSPEWVAYGMANPHLNINAAADEGVPDPITIRDQANKAKEASVRILLSKTGLNTRVSTTDHHALARDGARLPIRAYQSIQPPSPSPRATEPTTAEPLSQPSHPLAAALLYYHGGGMLLGSLSTEDYLCSTWADALGPDVVIISVCYRHTPENTFPTQQHDACDAFEWVVDHANLLGLDTTKIVIGGVSSGGGLAAGVLQAELQRHRTRPGHGTSADGKIRIRGQILAMPWLVHRDAYPLEKWSGGGREDRCSVVQCRNAPIMCARKYGLFTDLLRVEDGGKGFSVGLATREELEGTPPTAVVACGWDMLRDEAMDFAGRMEAAGASTKKHVFPGLPHSFTKYPDLPSSRRFNELIVESVRWCLEPNPQADKPGRWEMEMPDGYRGVATGPEKQQREEQDKQCSDGVMRRWIPELRGNRWGALI
ncbi:Alpha/Beta hydrolase protein [Schizothecium vesticola]|uniref:Alpha/Beta hydrolase protein n=1 Tax=Schizothecium vesticola TaxID=314040 RepID=A0AA40K267_9PEZI|nr:Alpha/Beta hydrolase protein [Schizothecium vesticola]